MERAATTGWSAANRLLDPLRAGRATRCTPCPSKAARRRCGGLRSADGSWRDERARRPEVALGEIVTVQSPSARRSGRASGPPTGTPSRRSSTRHCARSQARPSGNWYAFAASDSIRPEPPSVPRSAGVEIVAWRAATDTLHVGPGDVPAPGRRPVDGHVDCGALICPWHGLRLEGGREFGWKPYPAHDDGVLAWVRLDGVGGEDADRGAAGAATAGGARLHAVTRLVGTCEPRDIIANRLDPWHGAWFHPYSFTQLDVRQRRRRCRHCPRSRSLPRRGDVPHRPARRARGRRVQRPEPRTIVMRIVDGEGSGSVVETHATP